MTFCPSGCPESVDKVSARCPRCEMPLYVGEGVTAPDGKLYCDDCISEMDIDEILQICEISDTASLIGIVKKGSDRDAI